MSIAAASSLKGVYDVAVTSADLDEWEHEFDALMARMRPLFYRAESRKHAEQYIRGLLSPLARKNGWTIAEYVGEPEPKALQRLLNLSPWDVDACWRSTASTRWRILPSGRDTGGRSDRFREEGPQVGRCAAAVLGNAGTDRQLPDRHVLGVRHPGPGPGADRSPTVPAGEVVDGRPGPLRRGRRPRRRSPSRPGPSRSAR